MYITIVGSIMLIVFMTLILTKRTSALTALIVVPIVFGFIAGFGTDTFVYAMNGIIGVGGTISMLVFAILFFGIMLCAGLFDPLGSVVLKLIKGDPLRVILGTAILSAIVSLDGDGTTTIMICTALLMPVYTKLNMNRVYLAIFIIMPNGIINLLPWGGPTARLLAVSNLDAGELLRGLLPLILVGLTTTFIMAALAGIKERKRLGIVDYNFQADRVEADADESGLKRPQYIWFNLILSILVMIGIIAFGMPGSLVFAFGASIAFVVNYHNLMDERKVINRNAEGIVNIVMIILGAGILMGILSESGMAAAMAERLISIIPESWGSLFTLLVAIISGPAVWILNNDAFYFGLYPVLAQTATAYGYSNMQVGLASLMGQALRGFSPVIPTLYFLTSYVKIEFGDFQKKIIPYSFIAFAVNLFVGFFMNIYFLN